MCWLQYRILMNVHFRSAQSEFYNNQDWVYAIRFIYKTLEQESKYI